MNSFKTFILIALMTGLLVFLGAHFGGREGAVLALGVGILLNGFNYFFSDKIVLAMYGAKVVNRQGANQEDLKLLDIVENLAQRAGLPMPRVAKVPDQTPNAFATGRNPDNAVVAVTAGIQMALLRPELEAVLAHEIAHVKNRDILIGSFAAVLSSAIMFLGRMAGSMMQRGRGRRSANPLLGLVIMILAPIAALMLQMAISRSREYLADETAANITGRPDLLADALRKISEQNYLSPMQNAEPSTAHMMIVNPLSGSGFSSLFSTHPPIKKRIERLNAIRQKMY